MLQLTFSAFNRHQRCACAFLATLLLTAVPLQLLTAAEADLVNATFQLHLDAGEFGPANQMVAQARSAVERDGWLQQIAAKQAEAGMFRSSLKTAASIESDGSRETAFSQLAETPIGSSPARGGAALADFDSLIELIESTIAPDSWDEVGGPGAIEEFPGGVYVDTDGLIKRIAVEPGASVALEAARETSRSFSGRRDIRRASRLRKVSLTKLERHLQMLWARGHEPNEAMRNVAGLQRVQYIFVYPESRDIVLAGPAGDWTTDLEGRTVSLDSRRPVVKLDDLVVALRNAFSKDARFGCSITPRKENLAAVQSYLSESARSPLKPSQRKAWLTGLRERLGRQDVTVFGIEPRTRAARILVEADYRMKLVGMGLEPGTVGVTSYLDSIKIPEGGSPPPMDVLRWWFTLNHEGVRSTKARDAFEFHGSTVRVLSENEMLTERGERVHTGKSTANNSQFAHSFTAHFDELAKKYPIYAELRNVFDLAMVAAIIRDHDLHGQIDWQMSHLADPAKFLVTLGPAPTQVETVMNHRVIGKKHIVVGVSGGVTVDTSKLANSIQFDDYGRLLGNRDDARPKSSPDKWWWD
jgi:hypothetical protein